MKRSAQGFTLVELLIVIAIIAILAAGLLLIINPLELLARSRDSSRLQDMENLTKAIGLVQVNASGTSAVTLCYNTTASCTGYSNVGTRAVNGTGWISINFSSSATVTTPTLPIDPSNNATSRYTYYSDGTNYELNCVLESQQYKGKMSLDGGDNTNIYEVGSSLTLLH